jgi:hypothetical protein
MSPELAERIYQGVLQAVLSGAERKEVFIMLSANEITGDSAEAIYRRAWVERIRVIRSQGFLNAAGGLVALAVGAAFSWYSSHVISPRAVLGAGLALALGLIYVMIGASAIIGAHKKKGPVIIDD